MQLGIEMDPQLINERIDALLKAEPRARDGVELSHVLVRELVPTSIAAIDVFRAGVGATAVAFGTPDFDETKFELSFPDADYVFVDADFAVVLTDAEIHEQLRANLREQLRFSLKSHVNKVEEKLRTWPAKVELEPPALLGYSGRPGSSTIDLQLGTKLTLRFEAR